MNPRYSLIQLELLFSGPLDDPGLAVRAVRQIESTTGGTEPIRVGVELAGTVKAGVWTFEYGYTIPEQGCSGTVKGTGKVSADKKEIEGDVTIAGDCVEAPTPASFTFVQQAKK